MYGDRIQRRSLCDHGSMSLRSIRIGYLHSCSSCHSWFLVRNGQKINHESHELHESGRPNVWRPYTKTKPVRSWEHVFEVDPDWLSSFVFFVSFVVPRPQCCPGRSWSADDGQKINHESHERHESGRPNAWRSFTKTKPRRSSAHVLEVDPDWSYLRSCYSCHSWFLGRSIAPVVPETTNPHPSAKSAVLFLLHYPIVARD